MASPARKRQRMSSPTYDDQFDTSQDDLDAFDAFMASQPTIANSTFASASNLLTSVHAHREPELESSASHRIGFQSPGFTSAASTSIGFASPSVGFSTASTSKQFLPSLSALAKQQEKEKTWATAESGEETTDISPLSPPRKRKENPAPVTPPNRPSLPHVPANIATPQFSSASAMSSVKNLSAFKSQLSNKPAVFRSPLITRTPPVNTPVKSSTSGFHLASKMGPSTPTPQHFAQTFRTPRTSEPSSLVSPAKSLGMSARRAINPGGFISPLKSGKKPTELYRSKLSNVIAPTPPQTNTPPSRNPTLFNSKPSPSRTTLLSSGMLPSQYTETELKNMGIDIEELHRITPVLAPFYKFRVQPTDEGSEELRGPEHVLQQLLAKGSHLATKQWVDNHWALILWKLAGMVALNPQKEMDPKTRRWSWDEVIRQFLYRYERELDSGIRPPLRKICTQDAPAALPMVLCVSKVVFPDVIEEDEESMSPPEMELSDGWYKLRVRVDEPLGRAIRKGVIRVGRKLMVAGAKLDNDRKEPSDILEGYDSTRLILSGNSSWLAPWHARLGFQPDPCISTLHSLTPDGGLVSFLDVVIVKAYPIAYLEFKEDENGEKYREGPRNEVDEMKEHEKWQKRREIEESKVWTEHQKLWDRYESYAERLEMKAGTVAIKSEDDDMLDDVESLYDALEDAATARDAMSKVSGRQVGSLARYIRERRIREQEAAQDEVQREMTHLFPERQVRNFRVILIRDARANRRPANRLANLTIWDAKSVALYEGGSGGSFDVGHRFMVNNLIPSQPAAWMDNDEDESEIYLATRRDSTWRRIPK